MRSEILTLVFILLVQRAIIVLIRDENTEKKKIRHGEKKPLLHPFNTIHESRGRRLLLILDMLFNDLSGPTIIRCNNHDS